MRNPSHNILLKNLHDSEKRKKNYQRVHKKKDYVFWLNNSAQALKEVKNIQEEPLSPVSTTVEGKRDFEKRRWRSIKQIILLRVGTEYLIKAIFLKDGYSINKKLGSTIRTNPYKIYGNVRYLNKSRTIDFEYLKNHISSVLNLTEFDDEIEKENIILKKQNKGKKYKTMLSMNSIQCLKNIQSIGNINVHTSQMVVRMQGEIPTYFRFLNFICKKTFGETLDYWYIHLEKIPTVKYGR